MLNLKLKSFIWNIFLYQLCKKGRYLNSTFVSFLCMLISPKLYDQWGCVFLHLVGHVLPLIQRQHSFLHLSNYFFFFFFFAKIQFLYIFIDYSGLNCAIEMKPSASSRGNQPVYKISPICSLWTIVIPKNLVFTNFIYVYSVMALQLLN